jgi:hypothetical protein
MLTNYILSRPSNTASQEATKKLITNLALSLLASARSLSKILAYGIAVCLCRVTLHSPSKEEDFQLCIMDNQEYNLSSGITYENLPTTPFSSKVGDTKSGFVKLHPYNQEQCI